MKLSLTKLITAILICLCNIQAADCLDLPLELYSNSSKSVFSYDARPLRRYNKDGVFCEPAALDKISPWVILAALAAEDKRFFEHQGIDIKAIARAAIQNINAGKTVSGASTITQQLYKVYNPNKRTLSNKINEAFSAFMLERKYSKEDILQAYLNAIPYGNNTKGIQAASLYYFGINADNLSLSQAAAMAGIPKAPSMYNPITQAPAFEQRRINVLKQMLNAKYIDEETYNLAIKEKPVIIKARKPFSAPHFANWAAANSKSSLVYTTLVPAVQETAQASLTNQIRKLEKRHHLTNGAILVLDNKTNNVLAWVGSRDFFDTSNSGQVDGVKALRQPGSALKPFLYALAFAHGSSPADLISDEPLHNKDGYSPLNYDKTNHGLVTLRQALACSYNIPAVRLAEKLGTFKFLETLHAFGFSSLKKEADYYGAGLALGNGEVNLMELALAYATLARGGIYLPINFEKEKISGIGKRIIDEGSVFLINSVLSDNNARRAAFGGDSPAAYAFYYSGQNWHKQRL